MCICVTKYTIDARGELSSKSTSSLLSLSAPTGALFWYYSPYHLWCTRQSTISHIFKPRCVTTDNLGQTLLLQLLPPPIGSLDISDCVPDPLNSPISHMSEHPQPQSYCYDHPHLTLLRWVETVLFCALICLPRGGEGSPLMFYLSTTQPGEYSFSPFYHQKTLKVFHHFSTKNH